MHVCVCVYVCVCMCVCVCVCYRKVVEHGLYMKHCKVEVYLLEFNLCTHANQSDVVTEKFSRACTVGELYHLLANQMHSQFKGISQQSTLVFILEVPLLYAQVNLR